jgi:hypothetical protein
MVQIARDPILPVPPGLNEEEQRATMVKAHKQRGGGEELTVLPLGTPPLGGAWKAVGTIAAPGSGKPYRIYVKNPHRRGPGTTGTRTNHPVSDAGTRPLVEHKPPVPTGTAHDDAHQTTQNPATISWLGAVETDALAKATEELRAVVDNPAATEEQIAVKEAHRVALLGGSDAGTMKEVMRAVDRVGDMRNAEFEAALQQEERSPGSILDDKLKKLAERTMSGESQRQKMGSGSSIAMKLVEQAIVVSADRKADAVQSLLDQDKRSSGSVTDAQFQTAIQDFVAISRQSQLMGISRPKLEDPMATVAQVLKVMIQRKTEASLKLVHQKAASVGDVTDEQIKKATETLTKLKDAARSLGITGTGAASERRNRIAESSSNLRALKPRVCLNRAASTRPRFPATLRWFPSFRSFPRWQADTGHKPLNHNAIRNTLIR